MLKMNEEKKKIFFFGQPGCLKHSPIKTTASENHNNHNKTDKDSDEVSLEIKSEEENFKEEREKVDENNPEEEDVDSLLKKISEVLEENSDKKEENDLQQEANAQPLALPENDSIDQTATTSTSNDKNSSSVTIVEQNCVNISEQCDDLQSNKEQIDQKNSDNEEKIDINSSEVSEEKQINKNDSNKKDVISEVVSNLEDQEKISNEIKSNHVNDDHHEESSKSILLKSIVPYDDDSSSSYQSQVELDKEKSLVITQDDDELNKSASQSISETKTSNSLTAGEHLEPPLTIDEKQVEIVESLANNTEELALDSNTNVHEESANLQTEIQVQNFSNLEESHENMVAEINLVAKLSETNAMKVETDVERDEAAEISSDETKTTEEENDMNVDEKLENEPLKVDDELDRSDIAVNENIKHSSTELHVESIVEENKIQVTQQVDMEIEESASVMVNLETKMITENNQSFVNEESHSDLVSADVCHETSEEKDNIDEKSESPIEETVEDFSTIEQNVMNVCEDKEETSEVISETSHLIEESTNQISVDEEVTIEGKNVEEQSEDIPKSEITLEEASKPTEEEEEEKTIQVNYQLPLEIVKDETSEHIVDQPKASFIEGNISNQTENELESDDNQNVVVDKDLQSETNKEDKPEELSESKSEEIVNSVESNHDLVNECASESTIIDEKDSKHEIVENFDNCNEKIEDEIPSEELTQNSADDLETKEECLESEIIAINLESRTELPSENPSSKEEIEPVNNVLQKETSPIEEDQPMEVTEEIVDVPREIEQSETENSEVDERLSSKDDLDQFSDEVPEECNDNDDDDEDEDKEEVIEHEKAEEESQEMSPDKAEVEIVENQTKVESEEKESLPLTDLLVSNKEDEEMEPTEIKEVVNDTIAIENQIVEPSLPPSTIVDDQMSIPEQPSESQPPIEVKSNEIVEETDNKIVQEENFVQKSSEKCEEVKIHENDSVDDVVKDEAEEEQFTKPPITRKRKISERKSISESDSDGNVPIDSVSHGNSSDDEEVVLKKKPRMRGRVAASRRVQASRKAANKTETPSTAIDDEKEVKVEDENEIKPEDKKLETLQNLQFDYDGNEDVAANVAAIKTLICKEPKKDSASEKSDDEAVESKPGNRRGRKGRRGRFSKRNDAESSSDEDSIGKSKKVDNKRSKTNEDQLSSGSNKKKRESGLLKYIDTSLVIDTTENEAPVRQSRRIAQQKIREETERRQMEEKMLKQMKLDAEKKKKNGNDVTEEEYCDEDDEKKESSNDDESFKGTRRKKKSKIKPADKQWQTSSSHSEHSESEDYMEHIPSDPGSPLFKSDHEFSPESDVDDTTQTPQPVKRARTAKKLEAVSSSDEDEDINPNHACQVCHKTDSPEWILLCDECDCGYHCSCLKPIIFLIPSGNWYCPLCCHKKLISDLSNQLSQLDTLICNIETAEVRKQRQKLAEISEQNILQERRKNRIENASKSRERDQESSAESNSSSESENSSDNAPLKDYFYKLRKRNQTAAPSYRFNEYDDLINSAIRDEMDEVKGAGNLGRGKDISTIIEADKDEKKQEDGGDEEKNDAETIVKNINDDGESSGSDVVRTKNINRRKKKNRKLNNLDISSDEEEHVSDEDFKGTSSSDSEIDEEDLSMSSVSESSLDLPSKRSKGGTTRRLRNREKRLDKRFINDNDSDSDDEPLIKTKRIKKKKIDSDEEDFDINDDDDDEASLAEEIDSEDLCDDTETDSSSESAWPKRKKKRQASYDVKPRKGPKKKDDNEDKAFRAGISKKKILKKSENESEASLSDAEKGKRKTRGKKLLYLIEDDLDSDESDGIKPGVKRPETPPEEREMFFKKQEEIKRMLAAKDTEAAKKLAAPTIEPFNVVGLEMPKSPSPMPFSNEPASLSTIPKNVIESAKALDTDYNRIKPIFGGHRRAADGTIQSNDMNEEELAKMMEEEDFAQHQLKLAGEAIARSKKLLELEAKEEEFAAYSKVPREKEWIPPAQQLTPEAKKRVRKPKSAEKSGDETMNYTKALTVPQTVPPSSNLPSTPMPPLVSSNLAQALQKPHHPPPPMLANLMQRQQQQPQHPQQPQQFISTQPSDRPSVLSSFMTRPETMHLQHLKIHQPLPPEAFNPKNQQPLPTPQQSPFDDDEKKKGRRKKFTPLRTDGSEGNITKLAKLDPPSVIQSTHIISPDRVAVEDKSKIPRSEHHKLSVAAPPQIFNPATNPTPSVITRLLQPQQRPGPTSGPYGQTFSEVSQANAESSSTMRIYAAQEDVKGGPPTKVRTSMQPAPSMPQSSFGEHPFVPRNIHTLYRGPPTPYGIPPHARLPPYPFHHLHPNLRPGEYSAPYNIPPQFSYYAPPAHSRQPPQASAIPLNHGASQNVAGPEDISNSIRNANNSEEPSETSEFGGLVSYFSSQQELD